ncbi:MAG TPA: glycoside hydrolase family 95 protein, partial [Pyrinomonadaceae bacterium]|nr:glycoside hydrolase family 95 protein [Pyrinomonadaceae bacterium]
MQKITRRRFLGTAAILPFASSILKASADDALLLWFDKPASEWTEALPIGNGRLGAMIFGGVATEQIQLNEDTLYAGSPYDPNNPEALQALPEARRLIFAGEYQAAHDLVGAKMMAQPIKQMPYEPVGDLKLTFAGHENVTNYRRQLDLNTAIARTTYDDGVTIFEREIFASPVDQVIVVSLVAERLKQLNFAVTFETPQNAT